MPDPLLIEPLIIKALEEDLGHGHDITSESLIDEDEEIKVVLRARTDGVIAGIKVAQMVFEIVDPDILVTRHMSSGHEAKSGDVILTAEGNAISILRAERTALNLISHLSGIATETAKYVEAIKGTKANICDTRKTLPGLRALQKYAVKAGGGMNHRFGLDDAILIKDNHIAAVGGIQAALDAAKKNAGHMVKIEIEVDTLEQLQDVIDHGGADIVLLDNMGPDILKKAVEMVDGKMVTEASGGINLETVSAIAQSGVDMISVGALTHSVTALDIGLDFESTSNVETLQPRAL